MIKRILIFIGLFSSGIAGGIFGGQILWPYLVERPLFYEYDLDRTPVTINKTEEVFIQENIALREAISKCSPVVITVETEANGEFLRGSGLAITSDGLMVTLADLVPKGGEFNFYINNSKQKFQVLKRDTKKNLSLIKLEDVSLKSLNFAEPSLGERVFLSGKVFSDDAIYDSVNEGIIKSFDKTAIITNMVENESLNGSALFNIEGDILGINHITDRGEVETIPSSAIKAFADL